MQAGVRSDFQRGASAFTVQGDWQRATLNKNVLPEVDFDQFNVLGRWEHQGERVNTRLQMYFDRTDRGRPPDGIAGLGRPVSAGIPASLRAGYAEADLARRRLTMRDL